jgi:hypothetical protein
MLLYLIDILVWLFRLIQSAKVRNNAIGQTFFRTFAANFEKHVYQA